MTKINFSVLKISAALALAMAATGARAQAGMNGLAGTTTALESDQQLYCRYVTEQAAAQRDLLRTPSAVAGITQPNTGLPMQAVWGVSSSLSNIRKGGLTMDAAKANCELYNASTGAQQKIQYAAPSLEKAALNHRLDLIAEASGKLDATMATTTQMMQSQNATRPMLFALETTRIKLEADRADTQAKSAALYAPSLNPAPLRELVAQEQALQASEQAVLDKLNRQNTWDVALAVGAHQQINPAAPIGAYGEVTVSYNLGSRAIDKHLDETAKAYGAWKNVQENDIVRNAMILQQQIRDEIAAQTSRLKSLQEQEKLIDSNLQVVSDATTSAALDFHNQLTSAQLLLGIEIGDASFRLTGLQTFQRENF